MDFQDTLSHFIQLEHIAGNDPEELAELEQLYETATGAFNRYDAFLRQRNQFRIRHIGAMQIRRPRMLFDDRSFSVLNFQSRPALRHADTVILSSPGKGNMTPADDIIILPPHIATMDHLVQKLPTGYMPDFYFNYQVCSGKWQIPGWERAPFPTVAGLCHMFKARRCREIAQLFDFVLPLSPVFSEPLRECVAPEKIIDIPYGLNWGHFSDIITPGPDDKRDIDVLLSFPDDPGNPLYGNCRHAIHQLFQAAQNRFGDRFRFLWPGHLAKTDYICLLQRSRIVLNAVGIHGPYNYRTNEAIAAGALLMEPEPDYITGPQHMDQILTPDKEYVPFRQENFLSKLAPLLENEQRRAKIAHNGMRRMETEYSYSALYSRLFAELPPRLKSGDWRPRRVSAERALLARVGHALQNIYGTVSPEKKQMQISLPDLNEILKGKIGAPQAMMLALWPRLPQDFRQHFLQQIFPGQQIDGDTPEAQLIFCNAMIRALKAPAFVDFYNYIILCAGAGQMQRQLTEQLLQRLDQPGLVLTEAEILRIIVFPEMPGLEPKTVASENIRIFNLPVMLSGKDAVSQMAARDYMRINLYHVMARTAPQERNAWEKKAEALLAAYPVEGPRPDYAAMANRQVSSAE